MMTMNNKTIRIPRFLRDSSGVAAIETAMLMPVFLLMVFGAIGYGYVIYTKQELYFVSDQVTREIYLRPEMKTEEIVASIKQKLNTNLNMENLTVNSNSSKVGKYEYRTIEISYAMPLMMLGYNHDEVNIKFDKKLIISN